MKSFMILPMVELFEDAVWLELYEECFVKELYEMSFYVHNRMNDINLRRVGIEYTLTGAIDEEIVSYVNANPEFEGYISREDYHVIFDIISQAYHFVELVFNRLNIDPAEQSIVLTPYVWVMDKLIVKVQTT